MCPSVSNGMPVPLCSGNASTVDVSVPAPISIQFVGVGCCADTIVTEKLARRIMEITIEKNFTFNPFLLILSMKI
ncbi:MAG: hypothetical protein QXH91_06135 [Candidatus Bathyarchaeia archaeon]